MTAGLQRLLAPTLVSVGLLLVAPAVQAQPPPGEIEPGGSPFGDPAPRPLADAGTPDLPPPSNPMRPDGLVPPPLPDDERPGEGEGMEPSLDPHADPINPERTPTPGATPPTGQEDGRVKARPPAVPGLVGPPLERLGQVVVTPSPERLLFEASDGLLYLCDPLAGRCTAQSEAGDNPPVCATHLRNGWVWALSANGVGRALCDEACGPDWEPGSAPPLPERELKKLPEGATQSCGNSPRGASYWIGEHTMHRWGDRADLEVTPLPGATGSAPGPSVASPGRLWMVRDGRLWGRIWEPRGEDRVGFTDYGDVSAASSLWPAGCPEPSRRLDQLIYSAPAPRGLIEGLKAGVWGMGPCGLVPLHLFDLERGRSEAMLWPAELLDHPAWPPPKPLHAELHQHQRVYVVAPSADALGSDAPHAVRQGYVGLIKGVGVFAPSTTTVPLEGLARVVQVEHRLYALGDGVVELNSARRVGLTHGEGQPFGVARLRQSAKVGERKIVAVVTSSPPGLWVWTLPAPRPRHLAVAGGDPDAIEEMRISQDEGPAISYRIDGVWWVQSLVRGRPARQLNAAPAELPELPELSESPEEGDGSPAEADEQGVNGVSLALALALAAALLGGIWWWRRSR